MNSILEKITSNIEIICICFTVFSIFCVIIAYVSHDAAQRGCRQGVLKGIALGLQLSQQINKK